MTKLVSSQVVRKDNKYVVQKYMGKSRSVPGSQVVRKDNKYVVQKYMGKSRSVPGSQS